jgi:hypothetical protein
VNLLRDEHTEAAEWISGVKARLPAFLEAMKGRKRPGFYRYSYSGDRPSESAHWGLGNTAFAAKCWYTIGLVDELTDEDRHAMVSFIESFRRRDGLIYDAYLRRRALPGDVATTVLQRRWRDPPHVQARRAETRQAYSALRLLGHRAPMPALPFTNGHAAVERFLDRLDWTEPWNAGSHVSHLLFFLAHGDQPARDELIEHVVARVHGLQQADGSWYEGAPDLAQRINGAMKVITGLKVAGRTSFERSAPLIDLCLAATQDRQACDNFNIIFVLKYASTLADGYRRSEIEQFCLDRLAVYRRYYRPAEGGFSFWENAANDRYYGALVSDGRNEPDLHGTTLFMWGLSVIAQLLRVDELVALREFDA